MNKQLIEMIEAVAYEKSMPIESVWSAMEAAVAALVRKEQRAPLGEFHANILKDGSVEAFRVWHVVEDGDIIDLDKEVSPSSEQGAALLGDGHSLTPGADVHISVPEPAWTRQGAQVVKQVLAQRIKQGLRVSIAEQWGDRVGTVVLGMVKRIDKDRVVIDLGEPVEGVMGPRDRIPGEMFKIGHRIRVLIKEVTAEGNGPVVVVSRSSDDFLRELVAIEVPEVELGQIVIHAVARDPGSRAKVAVEAGPGLRHHPAAVCVGMRGVRAQAISNEINGERVEFIEWSPTAVEFLLAALQPAEVRNIVVDEDERRAYVGVEQENLARAIGSRGQNVRLAARLTGWTLDLMSTEELANKREGEDRAAAQDLISLIDIDEELADALVEEGLSTIEDICMAPLGDLLIIEGMTQDVAEMLQARARDTISLKQMLADSDSDQGSLDTVGVTDEEEEALLGQGIATLQDLADCAVGDVDWPDADVERLGSLIIAARTAVGMI